MKIYHLGKINFNPKYLTNYRSITIINNNISCLVIVIDDEDGCITIPVIISIEIAQKFQNNCEEYSLIGIKGKLDYDKNGLIIRSEKISFLGHREKSD